MQAKFTHRLAVDADIPAIQQLVATSFAALLVSQCSATGARTVSRYIGASAFAHRLQHDHVIVLCHHGHHLVGLIELRDFQQLSLLCVAPAFQRRGIARTLVQKAVTLSRQQQMVTMPPSSRR